MGCVCDRILSCSVGCVCWLGGRDARLLTHFGRGCLHSGCGEKFGSFWGWKEEGGQVGQEGFLAFRVIGGECLGGGQQMSWGFELVMRAINNGVEEVTCGAAAKFVW